MQELRAFSAMVGVVLSEAKTAEEGPNKRFKGRVLCINPALEAYAAFFGHLTSRKVDLCSRIEDTSCQDFDIIVLDWSDVSILLLDNLYRSASPSKEKAPGLLICDEPEQFGGYLKRVAISRCGSRSGVSYRNDVFPALQAGVHSFVDGMLCGREAPADVRKDALTSGADVLSVLTHSDGIDADLGPSLVLCQGKKLLSDRKRGSTPFCVASGGCARVGIDHGELVDGNISSESFLKLPEALQSQQILPVEELQARVLIWLSCWGLPVSNSTVAPNYSLATGWVEFSNIGAVVTTWGLTFRTTQSSLRIVDQFCQGEAIGCVVKKLNSNAAATNLLERFALLGDPDVLCPVLQPRESRFTYTEPARRTTPFCTSDAAFAVEVVVGEEGSRSQRLSVSSQALIHALANDNVGSSPLSDLQSIQNTLVDFVTTHGSELFRLWLPEELSGTEPVPVVCRWCSAPASAFNVRLSEYYGRLIEICPICGVTKDKPLDKELRDYWIDKTFIYLDCAPEEVDTLRVLFEPYNPAQRTYMDWPRNDKKLENYVHFNPEELPVGPFYLSIVCLQGLGISVFRRRLNLSLQ